MPDDPKQPRSPGLRPAVTALGLKSFLVHPVLWCVQLQAGVQMSLSFAEETHLDVPATFNPLVSVNFFKS